jgi:predicted nucleic acid-binding protein
MGQIVIADTSPIIYLARLKDGFSWLTEIYGEVVVTSAVHRELLPAKDAAGKREVKDAFSAGILREIKSPWITPNFPGLDEGEESTLRAAVNLVSEGNSCLVLVDDKDARRVLRTLRSNALQFSGTVALIARLKERGIIKSVAAELEKLRRMGFRISDDVVRLVLESVGENPALWPLPEKPRIPRGRGGRRR